MRVVAVTVVRAVSKAFKLESNRVLSTSKCDHEHSELLDSTTMSLGLASGAAGRGSTSSKLRAHALVDGLLESRRRETIYRDSCRANRLRYQEQKGNKPGRFEPARMKIYKIAHYGRLERVDVGNSGEAVCALAEYGRLPRLPSVVRVGDAVSLRTDEGLDERPVWRRRRIVSIFRQRTT